MSKAWRLLGLGTLVLVMGTPLVLGGAVQDAEESQQPKKGRLAEKTDQGAQAWVQELAKHFSDKNPTVRHSARAGLLAAGKAALPALRKIAEGDDDAADIAQMMIASIERGRPGLPGLAEMPFRFEMRRPATPEKKEPRQRPVKKVEAPKPPEPKKAETPPTRSRITVVVPGVRPGMGIDRAMRNLDLTEKQRAKIEEITTDLQKKIKDMTQKVRDGSLDRSKLRAEVDKVQDEVRKRIKEVLTEEQRKKFEAGPGGGRGSGAGGRATVVQRAVRGLDLDAKQKARVEEILAANQKKARELVQKLRSRELDREKARAALEELQQGLRKDLKEVLTAEQMKKVEEKLQSLRRPGRQRDNPQDKPAKPSKRGSTPADKDEE
jgi:Spy/CpxP family protein refolding chaperone